MKSSPRLIQLFLLLLCFFMITLNVVAQDDPDGAISVDETIGDISNDPPPFHFPSDQRKGSLLIFNLYASSASNPAMENTRINITNTAEQGVAIHLFFVDGDTCSVADSYICLTANQTTTLLASDMDPGISGYLIAAAVGPGGYLVSFNALIGDEYVKLSSGYYANLNAIGFSDRSIRGGGTPPSVPVLKFSGSTGLSRLPRVLAIDNIPSRADGFETLLVVNRIGGSLISGMAPIGNIFGLLFDELEQPYSFTSRAGSCQLRTALSESFPRTIPRLSRIIPAGQTGWAKFWVTDTEQKIVQGEFVQADRGILGAVLYRNAATGFSGGHNLHHLTFTNVAEEVPYPVFPPNGCY